MHKIHVTALIEKDLATVFSAVSDHRSFLTGGGLTCHLIKKGSPDKNGMGAIRTVRNQTHTFTEEINAFVENESFDYLITEIKPKLALQHHAGWLEFNKEGNYTRVDWHSHFTFTTPIVGHFIGLIIKKKIQKVFLKRLLHLNK